MSYKGSAWSTPIRDDIIFEYLAMANKCLWIFSYSVMAIVLYITYLYKLPSLHIQDVDARFILSGHTYQRISRRQVLRPSQTVEIYVRLS